MNVLKKKLFQLLFFFTILLSCVINAQNSLDSLLPILPNSPSQEQVEEQIDTIIKILQDETNKGNFDKIIEYGLVGSKLAKSIEDTRREFRITSRMGNAYLRINDTIRAKKLFLEAIKNAEKNNDSISLIGSLIDLGNVFAIQKKHFKSIEAFKRTIPLAEKTKDTLRLFILHYNISELYLNEKRLQEANYHIKKTAIYLKPLNTREIYVSGHELLLGRFHLYKNNLDKAISHFKKNIAVAKKKDYMDGIVEGYQYYMDALAEKKDYKELFIIKKEFDVYNNKKYEIDKLTEIEKSTAQLKIAQYEQQLKASQLESELTLQKASRNKVFLYYTLLAFGTLMIFFVYVLMSLRKRKKLVKDLKEKNQQYLLAKQKSEELALSKAKFFSTISHELRTPLYGIIGISSILLDDDTLDRHKEDVKSLKFSADYLLSLVNDVLQITKLDATANNDLNITSFNLKELVDSILVSFEFMRAQNNNEFTINIDKDLPKFIDGDRLKISQILLNLIGNSCKFTENGIILVSIGKKEITKNTIDLQFTIEDTGIGISEERQKTIFDEFAQSSYHTQYEGTGLGLPIVKKLIDLHHSKIQMESEPDVGTKFSFVIQFNLSDKEPEEIKDSIIHKEDLFKDRVIMVVDDNRINQIVTQKILQKHGANSLIASNGKEALDLFKEKNIDLILMDINMPIMNGFEATKEIRSINPTIPIIALTAVELDELNQKINASGMNGFVVMPYDINKFIDIIQENLLVIEPNYI